MELGYPIAAVIAAVPGAMAYLKAKKVNKNVGETNGAGTLATMNETILMWCEAHQRQDDERHAAIVGEQKRVREELARDKT